MKVPYRGGLENYVATANELAQTERRLATPILMRMLLAKALFGLSAVEYGLFGLHGRPLRQVRHYRTKKQTTAMFARINDPAARPLVDDKLEFHRLCKAAGLPVPGLQALISRGSPTGADDVPVVATFRSLLSLFAATDEIRVIIKPRRDALGTGVRYATLRSGKPFDIDDEPIDVAAFEAALQADLVRDDYLVQSFVGPHADVARMGTGKALGTLRVATFLKNGSTSIVYALVRIPASGNVHDNFSSGANGNLIAHVDVASGKVGSGWGRRSPNGRLLQSFECNPDSARPIRGTVLPRWEEVRALVTRAAGVFPRLPFLGWDIALSVDGLVIIEANSNPDIIGVQVSSGKGAAEILRPLFAD